MSCAHRYQPLRKTGSRSDAPVPYVAPRGLKRFKRLRRLLRSNGIFHRYHRKYVATTDSNHNLARLPNLINRQFNRYAINQAWCGDITYIPTDEGWLFMASVLDLACRCLVGYSFDSTMKTSLVVDALRMAIANEHPAPGLIFHSDQGSQY